jgi:polar amino acid transport system substrate-binding protein
MKILILLIILCFIVSCNEKETLVVAGDIYCPYNCDSNSEQQGYVIDIIRKIYEQKLGYKIDYKTNVTWTECLKKCETGEFDIIVEGTRAELQKLIIPQQEVGITIYGFITRSDSPWFYIPNDTKNNKLVKWGLAESYDYGDSIRPFFDEYKSDPNIIKMYSSDDIFTEMFNDLVVNKTIDVIYEDLNILYYHINKLKINNLVKVAGTYNMTMIYIAFSQKNKNLAKKWDEYILQLHKNGFIKNVLQKYDLIEWK